MKRHPRLFLERALDSLILSIEMFNRPWERGRSEAVLILLDRAFELFLKGAILHRGGAIVETKGGETIGFAKCVRKCRTDASVAFLTASEEVSIQLVNGLRDAAQHDIVDLSEQQLYLCAQAGVTVFRDILARVFASSLADHLPERVLPVSTCLPPPAAN